MKELLQEINTSCKDCIFATWEEDTQVGCDLGKIKLYKERKTPIIEAFAGNVCFLIDSRVF